MPNCMSEVAICLMITTMGAVFMSIVLLFQVTALSSKVDRLPDEIRAEIARANYERGGN